MILLYVALGIVFFFLLSLALAPLNTMREYKHTVSNDSLFLEKFDSLYMHPELRMLVKEKAYKEALLKLSERDSIQLNLNLSDSSVNLSIRGVTIYRVGLTEIRNDRLLNKMPVIQQVNILSRPLLIEKQNATIVKEPIVVRHAPKDTVEAALNVWQPDTLVQQPAFVMFSLEQGIHLIMEQDQNPDFRDKWKKLTFYSNIRWRNSIEALGHFFSFKKQVYHPTIIIKMPVDELRAIYRALPVSAYTVIMI